jgi:steroid 5-alpha reductase family enzyme
VNDAYDIWFRVLLGSAAFALVWAVVWWAFAGRIRRNDIADVAWGLLFPTLAWITGGVVYFFDAVNSLRAVAVLVLVSIWGCRLAWHIGRRAMHHDGEDKRYAALRQKWNGRWEWPRSLVQVFLVQVAIALVVVQPVLIAVDVHEGARDEIGVLDVIAGIVVLAGLLVEATADRQLAAFMRRKRAGEVDGYLTTGVWAWSRHPNYAGDAILWWGFGLFGIAAAVESEAWWLIIPAVLGPVVMTLFLRYGSGVPMTERGRSGPEWEAYVARTSAFLPRSPRQAEPG